MAIGITPQLALRLNHGASVRNIHYPNPSFPLFPTFGDLGGVILAPFPGLHGNGALVWEESDNLAVKAAIFVQGEISSAAAIAA